ncbi:hypothetical protein [Aquisphaera insulae]|uniref:hypothetical protein n=1 Tax=Aquisphaera insulae TaxID=2712864 RepID=UPI0013EB1FC0|nr:hypothetical protein [Aquisphaera insulae]
MDVSTLFFVLVLAFGMVYASLGNYLYLFKVLPALSRAGLDGSQKLLPSQQLEQIDQYLARFPADAPRPWFHGLLSHFRLISTVLVILTLLILFTFILGSPDFARR